MLCVELLDVSLGPVRLSADLLLQEKRGLLKLQRRPLRETVMKGSFKNVTLQEPPRSEPLSWRVTASLWRVGESKGKWPILQRVSKSAAFLQAYVKSRTPNTERRHLRGTLHAGLSCQGNQVPK